jgi:hypothetical protein
MRPMRMHCLVVSEGTRLHEMRGVRMVTMVWNSPDQLRLWKENWSQYIKLLVSRRSTFDRASLLRLEHSKVGL